MSHGASSEELCEPNLTPLLDLVLQLIMFFMLVANFVMEDHSGQIELPSSSQAKPLTSKDLNFIYLNIDRDGRVVTNDRPEGIGNQIDIKNYMENVAKKHPLGAETKNKLTIIIRADKFTQFRHIHACMSGLKMAEYKYVQLRAEVK